jgi:hypothetical protein
MTGSGSVGHITWHSCSKMNSAVLSSARFSCLSGRGSEITYLGKQTIED